MSERQLVTEIATQNLEILELYGTARRIKRLVMFKEIKLNLEIFGRNSEPY